MTHQIAVYGKGGIGKSTVSSHVSVALALSGSTVLLVGCDPKADSTFSLLGGRTPPSILDLVSARVPNDELLDRAVMKGYAGVLCCEAGGPEPGIGCAGRGIIVAIESLGAAGAFEALGVDHVVYDVPGDVVCGGFAMPMRKGFAEEVYIVTSPEYASLYAANNIARGVRRFSSSGGAMMGGIIANMRSGDDALGPVSRVAEALSARLSATVPWDPCLPRSERRGTTLFESGKQGATTEAYATLAEAIRRPMPTVPTPLKRDALRALCQGG